MAENYYKVLGLNSQSSDKEIRSAYRRLARRLHPDVNHGSKDAGRRFKQVNEAYQVLSDRKTRQDYDAFGENWRHADQIREARRSGSFGPGGGERIKFEDLGDQFRGFGPFNDMFNFGRRGGHASRVQAQRIEVQISLQEAYLGTTRMISVQGPEDCESCGGGGRRGSASCAVCRGSGTQVRNRRLEVKIPAGIDDSGRIKLRPTDNVDLFIKVRVCRNGIFQRTGSDLCMDVGVPYLTAILGGEVEIRTMTGNILLKIPAGTQNGTAIRIANKGMPRLGGGGYGALVSNVRVMLPESITQHEKEIFEQLRKLGTSAAGESVG